MDISTSTPTAPIASMTLEEACKQVDTFRTRELHHSDEIYDTAESMKAIDDAKLWEKEAGWVPPKTKPRKKKETKTRKNRGDRRTGARNRWAGQRFKMDPRQASKYFIVAEELKREDVSGTGLSLDKMEQVAMAPVEFRYTLIELGKTYSASALRGGRLKTEHLLGKFDLTEVLRLLAIAVSTSALKEASAENQEKKERKRKDPSPELVTRHLMKAMEELERIMAAFPFGMDDKLLELMQEQMAILQERMEDLMSLVEAGTSSKNKGKDQADSAKTEEGKSKETSTNDKSKETSTNDNPEATSTNDKPKETSTNDKSKETSTNDKPKETSTNDKSKETSTNDNPEATSTKDDRRKEAREEEDAEDDLPPLPLTENPWYYPICRAINSLPPQTKEVLRDHLYQMVLGTTSEDAKAMILGLYEAAKMRKARIGREDFDKFVSPLIGDDRELVGNICVEILVLAELPQYTLSIRRLYTHNIPRSVADRIAEYIDSTYLSKKTPEDEEYLKNGGPDAPLVVQGRMILRRMLEIREDLRKGIKPNIHIQRWLYESTIKLAELKSRAEMDLLY